MNKKIIAFICAFAMLLLCFVSCDNGTNAGDNTNLGEILISDLAGYTIIYGKSCDTDVIKKADVLAAKLYAIYGVTVKTGTDSKYEQGEKEILVGYTDRPESLEFLSDIRSEDFGYAMVDGKLCIAGATEEFTIKAIDKFMNTVVSKGGEKWELGNPNITRGEYAVDGLSINGESIKGWSITYTSDNQNSEKEIATLIRDKIAAVSGFAPILCTEKDNITQKVINVRVEDSDADISVTDNCISVCGRDKAALMQAAVTLMGQISRASANNNVLEAVVDGDAPIDEPLVVMSFNVRYDLTENEGVSRVDAAVAQIRALSPDVFGIQEDSKQWCTLLDQKLTEYTAVRSMLQAGQDEYLTIYYKTEKFSMIKSGLLWLSDTPSIPNSKFTESSMTRGMSYAVLERESDGAKLCFVNTHLEHNASASVSDIRSVARQKQTQVLLEQTAKIVSEYGDIPSIMVGDFNSTVSEAIHGTIRSNGYNDCRTEAFSIMSQGTWNDGYYGNSVNKNSDILDYCYASKNGFFISEYKVSAEKYNNMYTSDHFPIVVKLMITK